MDLLLGVHELPPQFPQLVRLFLLSRTVQAACCRYQRHRRTMDWRQKRRIFFYFSFILNGTVSTSFRSRAWNGVEIQWAQRKLYNLGTFNGELTIVIFVHVLVKIRWLTRSVRRRRGRWLRPVLSCTPGRSHGNTVIGLNAYTHTHPNADFLADGRRRSTSSS